jgi:hypothetical protein
VRACQKPDREGGLRTSLWRIIANMSAHFEDIEREARALPLKEKAALARLLIEELDPSVDADAEQLWIVEAQRRYDAYLRGELEALPGDDVMNRARNRIK